MTNSTTTEMSTTQAGASREAELVALFPGNGEMARRCRAFDWSATALGPVDTWPLSLRAAVRMALECPFPINLWCGPALELIYNDAYIALLGSKHPASLGRPGSEVWNEIWFQIAPLFDDIRAGGPAVFAEDARFMMERDVRDPGEAFFTYSLSPIRDESGEVVAFLNVATETTRRLQAEREAQEARAAAERAEEQLRDIFAQAPAFMAVLKGPDHVFEFANAAYMQLVGYREILGKTVGDALPEIREQGFVDLLNRVLNSGEPFIGRELPVMIERTPGAPQELAYLDFIYQPIVDANGERIGIVAHGSDVTAGVVARLQTEGLFEESERARARLAESESRYRFLANAIPVQVWAATPDGALDFVSDRTAEYFGKSAREVIGEQWLTVLHPDDIAPTLERWKESLETGRPYETEFRLWSAAHEAYRWHLTRATPQRDDSGRVVRWLGTNTEIEDRKQAEAELKRLTIEATEANRAKSNFLAAMSHELRTPLNAIGGYAQLIEMGVRGPVTEEQRIDLLKIQRSKNHLDALVGDVLNFAKLGAGRIEYQLRNIVVRDLLSQVVEMVAPQVTEKGLHLTPIPDTGALTIAADIDKVRQILLNLLANALKFTPAGGSISMTVTLLDHEVAISVSDTGIGIPPEMQEQIFEPFVQAKRALNVTDQGVGLGLAISRQLARAMHGDLKVRSAREQGSTFVLTLPRITGT